MQSEAKRSFAGGSRCNLRLQGDFQKLQGEPILLPVKFSNGFKILEGVLPTLRSRDHFWYLQGKEQGAFLILQGRAAFGIAEWWARVARGAGLNAGPRFAEITLGSEFAISTSSSPGKRTLEVAGECEGDLAAIAASPVDRASPRGRF